MRQSEKIKILKESLKVAKDCLKAYSTQTVTVVSGQMRLNYHGTDVEDGPTMSFYESETWLNGAKARDALKAVEKLEKKIR